MRIISVYAIFGGKEEADRIGRTMIEERLAACVNLLGEVRSIYRWKGKIETADEVAAIFKTSEAKVDALIARIAELHSYEVPCIAAWSADRIAGEYARFVRDNVD